MTHTKEPWAVGKDPSDKGTIYGMFGRLAVSIGGEAERTNANAARIVACVNACAGIADPAIVPELVAALERQADNMAFVLNNATISAGRYEKLHRELAEDRAILSRIMEQTT